MFYIGWWAHLLILLGYLVYLPQAKQAHEIAAIVNSYLRRLHAPGKLSTINYQHSKIESENIIKNHLVRRWNEKNSHFHIRLYFYGKDYNNTFQLSDLHGICK